MQANRRRSRLLSVTAAAGLAFGFVGSAAHAQQVLPAGTSFVYQGVLESNGAPSNTPVEMLFRLFDASFLGTEVGVPVQANVTPDDGRFAVSLDFDTIPLLFPPPFDPNQARWLEITVDGQKLSPRQRLEAAPFALNTRGIEVMRVAGGLNRVANPSGPISARFPGIDASITLDTPGGLPGMTVGRENIAGENDFSWNFGVDTDERWKMWPTDGAQPSSPFLYEFDKDGQMYIEDSLGIGTRSPDPAWGLVVQDVGDGNQWAGAVAAGSESSNHVVMGALDGRATLGGHNGTLDQWTDLVINPLPSFGNVGIGVTDPVFKLDVQGGIRASGANSEVLKSGPDGLPIAALTSATGNQNRGRVAVLDETLTIRGEMSIDDNARGYLDVADVRSSTVTIGESGSFKQGRLFVRAGNLPLSLQVRNAADTVDHLIVTTGGQVGCSGTLICSSDERLKENIAELDGALDDVLSLRGVTFDWNEKAELTQGTQIGFIAQEVEQVRPELVTDDGPNGMKAMAYGNVTALLVEAMQEQQAQIEALTARIESMEREPATLQASVAWPIAIGAVLFGGFAVARRQREGS